MPVSPQIRRLSFLFLSLAGCLPGQENTTEKPAEVLIEELVRDSQKHIKPRPERPARDVLRLAETAADLLAEDITAYTARLGDIVAACLKANRPDDALFLAEKMRLLGDESGFSRLMLASAHAGRTDEALAHLESLENRRTRLSGVRLRDITRDTVIARGLLSTGKADMGTLASLDPDTRMEAETAWLAAGKLASPPLTLDAVLKRLKKEGVSPLTSAHYVVTALEKALPTLPEEAVKPFADQAGSICTETHHPGAHHVLLELAQVMWNHKKQHPLANQAMTRYLALAAKYPAQAEWKGPYFADAVPVLLAWGEKDLAVKAAHDARATLEKVFVADVPRCLAAAAKAAHQAGMTAERDQALVDALISAKRHPHPRVAGDAAVECCLVLSDLGLPASEGVYKQLAEILYQEAAEKP